MTVWAALCFPKGIYIDEAGKTLRDFLFGHTVVGKHSMGFGVFLFASVSKGSQITRLAHSRCLINIFE